MARLPPSLPHATDDEVQFYVCIPLPSGTLTRADADFIEEETGCVARVRDRHDGRGRLFTLRGPPRHRERAYSLCQDAIAANGRWGGRATRRVQQQQGSSQRYYWQRRCEEYWAMHAQAALAMMNQWGWYPQREATWPYNAMQPPIAFAPLCPQPSVLFLMGQGVPDDVGRHRRPHQMLSEVFGLASSHRPSPSPILQKASFDNAHWDADAHWDDNADWYADGNWEAEHAVQMAEQENADQLAEHVGQTAEQGSADQLAEHFGQTAEQGSADQLAEHFGQTAEQGNAYQLAEHAGQTAEQGNSDQLAEHVGQMAEQENAYQQPEQENADQQPEQENTDPQLEQENADQQPEQENAVQQPEQENADQQTAEQENADQQPEQENTDQQPEQGNADQQTAEQENADQQTAEEQWSPLSLDSDAEASVCGSWDTSIGQISPEHSDRVREWI